MNIKFFLSIFWAWCLFFNQCLVAEDCDGLCSKEELSSNLKIDPTLKLKRKIVFTPKSCPYVGNGVVTPAEKKFCLNFAADYFYRLRYTEEDLVYKGTVNSQSMHRSKMSQKGALFMLAQVIMESGWGVGGGYATHNYWGLGGAYQNAKGRTTFMSFPSFETSFAFLFNHFERGILSSGKDWEKHSGWPGFLKLIQKDNFTTRELNQSLNSGEWCKNTPAYNVDPDSNCKKKWGCPCIDYSHFIVRHALSGIARQCIPTWTRALEKNEITEVSIVYANTPANFPPKKERVKKALEELSDYVQEKCLEFIK